MKKQQIEEYLLALINERGYLVFHSVAFSSLKIGDRIKVVGLDYPFIIIGETDRAEYESQRSVMEAFGQTPEPPVLVPGEKFYRITTD